VLRTARNCGQLTPTLLDDLVQETYLKLCADNCRLLRNFQSRHADAIFGFLKVVTGNVVHDQFKAAHAVKRGGSVTVSLQERERNEEHPIEPIERNSSSVEQTILLQEIDRCLTRSLSPAELSRSRRIFWLYYRCGLSARAIASLPEMNLNTKGVESILFRLNRLVRAALRQLDCRKIDPEPGQKGLTPAGPAQAASDNLQEVGNPKVGMRSFTATQSDIRAKHHSSREKKRQSSPEALPQVAEIQVPTLIRGEASKCDTALLEEATAAKHRVLLAKTTHVPDLPIRDARYFCLVWRWSVL